MGVLFSKSGLADFILNPLNPRDLIFERKLLELRKLTQNSYTSRADETLFIGSVVLFMNAKGFAHEQGNTQEIFSLPNGKLPNGKLLFGKLE